MRCDLLVLGDAPEAWAAATDAARLGARTVLLRPERNPHRASTGLAAVRAAFDRDAEPIPAKRMTCGPIRPSDLWRVAVRMNERRSIENLREFGIQSWQGPARLTSATTAEVFSHGALTRFEAKMIVIAVGTRAPRAMSLRAAGTRIMLPEDIGDCDDAPRRLAILGDNPTARAFARLFATAGSDVTLIDAEPRPVVDHAARIVRGDLVEFRQRRDEVVIRLANGRSVESDAMLLTDNRVGATASLGLPAVGLESDDSQRLWCDDRAMTWVPTIAAAGEVIGYPRGLRGDRQRVQQTIREYLGLKELESPRRISIHIGEAASSPNKNQEPTRARTRPRPRPALRLYQGP